MAFSKKQLEYSGKFFKELARSYGLRYSDIEVTCDLPKGIFGKFACGDRIPNTYQLMKIRDMFPFKISYYFDDLANLEE